MAETLAKAIGQPHVSAKLHRHLKKLGHSGITLRVKVVQG